jgi:Cu/Ag efflux protein CusF
MIRILAAFVVIVFSLGVLTSASVEAGVLDKLAKIYTATKIVRTANATRKRATLVRKYIKQIEAHSTEKFTVKQFSELKKVIQNAPGRLDRSSRGGFDRNRVKLRDEWTNKYATNGKWGTYEKPAINPKTGKELRPVGANLDAHHVIPLQYGGPNTAANIFPVKQPFHNSIIHAK